MAGIYIHIPFCKTRCIYCDFFSSRSKDRKSAYVDALCRELELRKNYLQGEKVLTIYFGGGTPSQLSPKDFDKIFTNLNQISLSGFEVEITLEANPDDITPRYLASLKDFPFNRISMGVQSFDDAELCFLNRRHTSQGAIHAIRLCQDSGFCNLSIDLMYGLPNQSMQMWENTLFQAIDLNVRHISAYHLIYEEGTRLHALLKENKIKPVDEDLSVKMFSRMIDVLESGGFEHYEISNFAKPGFISKHNSSYWNGTHYLGIGASAHSFNGKARHWNVSDLDSYIAAINRDELPLETEIIGETEVYNDFILTRMRTMKGLDLNELEHLLGKEKKMYCLKQARKHIDNQTVQIKDNYLRLTRKGIFISDGIMSDLFV